MMTDFNMIAYNFLRNRVLLIKPDLIKVLQAYHKLKLRPLQNKDIPYLLNNPELFILKKIQELTPNLKGVPNQDLIKHATLPGGFRLAIEACKQIAKKDLYFINRYYDVESNYILNDDVLEADKAKFTCQAKTEVQKDRLKLVLTLKKTLEKLGKGYAPDLRDFAQSAHNIFIPNTEDLIIDQDFIRKGTI